MPQKQKSVSGCQINFPNGKYESKFTSVYHYPGKIQISSTEDHETVTYSAVLMIKSETTSGTYTIPSDDILELSYIELNLTKTTALSGTVTLEIDRSKNIYIADFEVTVSPKASPYEIKGRIAVVN